MSKYVFMALFIFLSGPALAQGAVSEMPGTPGATNTAAAAKKASPALSYNTGMGPINLRPGAYIASTGATPPANGADTTAGRKSLPDARPNSASSYNQGLVNARAQAQRLSNSVIPSPFPPGF